MMEIKVDDTLYHISDNGKIFSNKDECEEEELRYKKNRPYDRFLMIVGLVFILYIGYLSTK